MSLFSGLIWQSWNLDFPFSRAQSTPCAAIVSVRVSPNGKGKGKQVKVSQPLHHISRWAERTGEERSFVSLGVWRFSPKLWCQIFSFKLATFTLSSIRTLTFIPSVPSLLSTDSWDCVELKNTQSLNGKNEKKFFPLMPATCFKKLKHGSETFSY